MSVREREEMEVDVLFVGGGIANLSAAYSLMQQIEKYNKEAEKTDSTPIEEPVILVIDKGAEPGNHILSGAVIDPKALNELFPELDNSDFPFSTEVKKDDIHFMKQKGTIAVPHTFLPKEMKANEGCYLGSLGQLTRWMAEKCEKAGVEVYGEFAASSFLYEGEQIKGVRLGDTGLNHDGKPSENYTPGMNVFAKITVLGEGSCGHLSQQLIKKHNLAKDANEQVWAVGIKELIKIPEGRVKQGEVIHTFGYPLQTNNYGGSFVYAYEDDLVGIGLVIGLDYSDPNLNVHHNFLKFKKHPLISEIIKDGKVTEYGAKTLPEGGYFAIPKLSVDGAVMVGDSAGMLDAMRLKGIHIGMKSGMLAAEKICSCLAKESFTAEELDYRKEFNNSWAGEEMYASRNYRQGFHNGLLAGMFNTGLHMISGGKLPSGRKTLPPDYSTMKPYTGKSTEEKVKTDQDLYLDIMADVYLSGTLHREDEPSHIQFVDAELLEKDNKLYNSPSTHFCPAEVYEKKEDENKNFTGIQINFSNCLHCKTCVIKDPLQNIVWTPPEGGEGPKYKNM